MKYESKCKKCFITIGAAIHLLFALIIGCMFAVWLGNAYEIQDEWQDSVNCDMEDCDVIFYDHLPQLYFPAQYSPDDLEDARKYMQEIVDDCGVDQDCYKPGNRFSLIYALSGTTMLLLALNSCFMLCGTCSYWVRSLTAGCGGLCSCLNFAAIITTGVFRYNSWGKLSALCEGPSKYDDDVNKLSDDWTVQGDAYIITGLWACQIIFLCTYCCFIGFTGWPSKE